MGAEHMDDAFMVPWILIPWSSHNQQSTLDVQFRLLCIVFMICMQGPTVSPVFCKRDGKVTPDYYAIVICVPKKALYKSVQQLRAVSHLY